MLHFREIEYKKSDALRDDQRIWVVYLNDFLFKIK